MYYLHSSNIVCTFEHSTFNKIILKTNSHEKINNILSYIFWFSIYIPSVSNYNGNNNKFIN